MSNPMPSQRHHPSRSEETHNLLLDLLVTYQPMPSGVLNHLNSILVPMYDSGLMKKLLVSVLIFDPLHPGLLPPQDLLLPQEGVVHREQASKVN